MRIKKKVSIIGVGLIGGSIGLALKEMRNDYTVVGVGRHIHKLKKAQRCGAIDTYTIDWRRGVHDADICIIATPVGTISKIFKRLYPFLQQGCIVTDAGSVKKPLIDEIEQFLIRQKGTRRVFFVGSHPLAGSDKTGVDFAKANLFTKAMVIVTPSKTTSRKALSIVKGFWVAIGAKVRSMSPERHDRILAATSHIPHVVAFALVKMVFEGDSTELRDSIASGFKDTTRIAASDPQLWTDILIYNRHNLNQKIQTFQRTLEDFRLIIHNAQTRRLRQRLLRIARKRRQL